MVARPQYNLFSPPRQGGHTASGWTHRVRDRIIVTNTTQLERVRVVVTNGKVHERDWVEVVPLATCRFVPPLL